MHTTSATYGTEQERVIFGEKSDHLGNVRAVVSDVRKPVTTTGSIDDWTWQADVTQSFAYYPFGAQMPGQSSDNSTVENGSYKFGFQGQLRDDSWHNIPGSHYDFGARIYDSRVGRWYKLDNYRRMYPDVSGYSFALNNPILFIDPDGNVVEISDAVLESTAFLAFSSTVQGEKFISNFRKGGELEKHILNISESNKFGGHCFVDFKRGKEFIRISKITAADINKSLILQFNIRQWRDDLDDIRTAETFAHEAFIHLQRMIVISKHLLSKIGKESNEAIAKTFRFYEKLTEIYYTKDGKTRVTHGGDRDHAKFIIGLKKEYNLFLKELKQLLPEKEYKIIVESVNDMIKQYSEDEHIMDYLNTEYGDDKVKDLIEKYKSIVNKTVDEEDK